MVKSELYPAMASVALAPLRTVLGALGSVGCTSTWYGQLRRLTPSYWTKKL